MQDMFCMGVMKQFIVGFFSAKVATAKLWIQIEVYGTSAVLQILGYPFDSICLADSQVPFCVASSLFVCPSTCKNKWKAREECHMYVKQENIPMQWARRDWPISCCCNGRHLMASRFDHSSVFFSISVTAEYCSEGHETKWPKRRSQKRLLY